MSSDRTPRCTKCGSPLDIIHTPKTKKDEVGACTNAECSSNVVVPQKQR